MCYEASLFALTGWISKRLKLSAFSLNLGVLYLTLLLFFLFFNLLLECCLLQDEQVMESYEKHKAQSFGTEIELQSNSVSILHIFPLCI